MENSKGKEFDGFQIILKLEICAEKIVLNCSTLKKNCLLFVTFKKQSRRQRVKWNKKVGPVSNWHGGVMVKAVLFEAKGGEDRFPAGPRALLRWSQNGRNRLSRIKKCGRPAIDTVV